MNFLAPLYVAGFLAISLPIFFHLIRRTPQGRQEFSSLMFLAPSPPRVTKRSRLTNILLLILRATALILLALAFARPFLRQNAEASTSQARGKRVAILVDTSASMQRGDLWQQATRQVDQVLGSLAPTDEVSLFVFDRDVRPAFTFKQWNELEQSSRVAMLKGAFAGISPTWASTNLGSALSSVADQLTESENSQTAPDAVGRQVILISDMQQGGHIEALQGHQWPVNVTLDVKRVTLKDSSNASLQLVRESAETTESTDKRLRVRIANQPDSNRDQFSLAWADEKGALKDVSPVTAYVPPGHSQIVRVAWPTSQPADRLVLGGDDSEFDNTLYLVQPRADAVRIVYLGEDAPDDPKSLRFYLEVAATPSADRTVEVVARKTGEPLADTDLNDTRLLVITSAQSDERAATIRKYIEKGGDVLWVLPDAAAIGGFDRVSQLPAMTVTEVQGTGFSLLARIMMDHPLFAPFADARFSDFTKIHFWKHRVIKLEKDSKLRVLASFDNTDPFLVEHSIGSGRLSLAAAGWQPVDSQLALSTKFVPLIDGMLKRKDGTVIESQHVVNELVALPRATTQPTQRSMKGPDGKLIELANDASAFNGADRPGIYRLQSNGQDVPIAVNLSGDEGRTMPVGNEELEQYGAILGSKPLSDEVIAKQRHLQVAELENKQKLWQWVIVGVLGLLIAETALAGRLAHRQQLQQVTT